MEYNLPVEIWEIIASQVTGETLLSLRQVNHFWKDLIDDMDQRKNVYKRCIKNELRKEDLYDILFKLYPKREFLNCFPWLYNRNIYQCHILWKKIRNITFTVHKLKNNCLNVRDLKTSGTIIAVADKTGVTFMDTLSDFNVYFKVGEVKHIELYCLSNKYNAQTYRACNIFGHDEIDITLINETHKFFSLPKLVPVKQDDPHENQLLRYCNGKQLILPKKRIIDADFFNGKTLILSNKTITQYDIKTSTTYKKTKFNIEGAREIFLWHSRLVFCTRERSIDIYLDGEVKTVMYEMFPPITAIFYYCSTLILGSKCGAVYIYSLPVQEIMNLNLRKYDNKVEVSGNAIVKINVIEDRNVQIVAATEQKVFVLRGSRSLQLKNVMFESCDNT